MTTAARVPLTSAIIKSSEGLGEYSKRFCDLGGNPIPLKYLQQSVVRGFFLDQRLVGGYALNNRPPFRYAEWIPIIERKLIEARGYFCHKGSVEVSCFWMAPREMTKLQRNSVYLRLVFDAFLSGEKYIIGGSVIPSVAKTQKQVLCQPLFHGVTTFGSNAEVYSSTRWSAMAMLTRAAMQTYSRDIRRSISMKRNKTNKLHETKVVVSHTSNNVEAESKR